MSTALEFKMLSEALVIIADSPPCLSQKLKFTCSKYTSRLCNKQTFYNRNKLSCWQLYAEETAHKRMNK